jgi:hypothetical protein
MDDETAHGPAYTANAPHLEDTSCHTSVAKTI